MKIITTGVLALYNNENDTELVGVVAKNEKTHQNIFYKCEEMGMDDIEILLTNKLTTKL